MCINESGKLVKERVVEKMSCLCVEEGIDWRAGGDRYIYWDEVLAPRSHGLERGVIESEPVGLVLEIWIPGPSGQWKIVSRRNSSRDRRGTLTRMVRHEVDSTPTG
jgi:hypothetical protein